MSVLTLIPTGGPFEEAADEADTAVRAHLITTYLAAGSDLIGRAYIAHQIAVYDQARPGEPPLMDEIRGLHLPAAA
ncbi:hypothetical protein ACL02U_11980 [Streptomyces sp. MS06]|uniref:hypothetical protein n=1 Tax=Streptomyces sp. MS06 TaxID=3385974 RepID=UPI0039A12B5D